jgi:hypothetical protein
MRLGVALLALVLLTGCQDNGSESSALPEPASTTREAILRAVRAGDQDALRRLIDPQLFFSDVDRRRFGERSLRTMEVLLQMPHQVRETNEGTLYQWPRFGPDSKPGEMSEDERRALGRIMSDSELRDAILPEVGYTSPRLGILEDGRWWFFVLSAGP